MSINRNNYFFSKSDANSMSLFNLKLLHAALVDIEYQATMYLLNKPHTLHSDGICGNLHTYYDQQAHVRTPFLSTLFFNGEVFPVHPYSKYPADSMNYRWGGVGTKGVERRALLKRMINDLENYLIKRIEK
jgi:hypothetical protein